MTVVTYSCQSHPDINLNAVVVPANCNSSFNLPAFRFAPHELHSTMCLYSCALLKTDCGLYIFLKIHCWGALDHCYKINRAFPCKGQRLQVVLLISVKTLWTELHLPSGDIAWHTGLKMTTHSHLAEKETFACSWHAAQCAATPPQSQEKQAMFPILHDTTWKPLDTM